MRFPLVLAWITAAISSTVNCPTAWAVTVIHTNDVLGEIESCGCRNNPQGGFARKMNLLKTLTVKDDLLQLDAGDLLFASAQISSFLEKQNRLQAQYLLKGLELMQQDVIVPGEKDFALGLAFFEDLIKQSKIKFIAANLKRKNNKKLINFLDPEVIFERKSQTGVPIRIAVFGLVGDQLAWPPELIATSPIRAAKEAVRRLRKKADVLIALTHQGLELDQKLAREVSGIDFIIGGHTQSFLQTPLQVGTTWIMQSSYRNQFIGVLPLPIPFKKAEFKTDAYRLIGLEEEYNSPANAQNAMDKLVAEFKNTLSAEASGDVAGSTSKAEAESVKPGFQTDANCKTCHGKQWNFWKTTKHAQSFQSLITKNQAKNKECLICHTLDPSQALSTGGGGSDTTHHDFTNVQCERCHGVGGSHPIEGHITKAVANGICLTCHTEERAPKWYNPTDHKPDLAIINEKHKKISCPVGESLVE